MWTAIEKFEKFRLHFAKQNSIAFGEIQVMSVNDI